MEEAVTDTLIKSAVQRVELLRVDGTLEPDEADDEAQNLEIPQEIR